MVFSKALIKFLFPFPGKPSRVIHIRNIPNESSETEVIQLGVSFGRVTNVLVLKGKNQAFLEMADEVSAAAIVACFNNNPPQVRGRTLRPKITIELHKSCAWNFQMCVESTQNVFVHCTKNVRRIDGKCTFETVNVRK